MYQDLRALASKLQQGNTIYFEAFSNYQKQKAAGALRKLDTAPVVTVQPPEPKIQEVFAATVLPSAPIAPEEAKMGNDVEFLRRAVLKATDSRSTAMVMQAIHNDRNPPLAMGNHPETLAASQPDASWKLFLAKLSILRVLQERFQKNCTDYCPGFIPWNEKLQNGHQLRDIGQGFVKLSDREFSLLQQAIINPSETSLSESLRKKLLEVSAFADILQRKPDFLNAYQGV